MRECPTCGRTIYLNREGRYRRHFSPQPDGSVRLCRNSGSAPPSEAPDAEEALTPGPTGRLMWRGACSIPGVIAPGVPAR